MARKKTGRKARMLTVNGKVRELFLWFEKDAGEAKERALEKLMEKQGNKGPVPDEKRARKLADKLEKIQRKLNPLETLHDEISKELLPYWGRTGVKQIKGRLGITSLVPSFTITLNETKLRRKLTKSQLLKTTERIFIPERLLILAERNAKVRTFIAAMIAASAKISITPPSSRRPKSGRPKKGREGKKK